MKQDDAVKILAPQVMRPGMGVAIPDATDVADVVQYLEEHSQFWKASVIRGLYILRNRNMAPN
jgi:hypothetical protein